MKPAMAAIGAGAVALSLLSSAFAQVENQPPVPLDDTASTTAGTAVEIDVLANDSDPDGQGVSITEWTQPDGGSVDVVDAIAVYTPDDSFTGEDTFEYTVSDGTATATATVTVTVEAPAEPLEAVDDTAETTVGVAVEVDVLANDTGPEGAVLSVETVGTPSNGTAEIVEGMVVYTPAAEFAGEDTFDYAITDGETTVSASVVVTVSEAAAPIETVDDAAQTTTGDAVQVDVLANDTAADGMELTIEAVTEPGHGTAEIVDGMVVYTPSEDFLGEDTFEYTVSDGEATATATVTVTVAGDPPNLDPRVVEACEGYAGDDATLKLLCRVYMSGNLSPFVQQIVGSIILLTMPAPEPPDPVMVACEEHAGEPAVDALCNLYQLDEIPDWLREQVGELILRLTEEAPEDATTDTRGRGDERGRGHAFGHR